MAKYQKKSEKYDAQQWDKHGDHPAVKKYDESVPTELNYGNKECSCGAKLKDHGWIDSFTPTQYVCPGDKVLTHENGKISVCRKDDFAGSYEQIAEV